MAPSFFKKWSLHLLHKRLVPSFFEKKIVSYDTGNFITSKVSIMKCDYWEVWVDYLLLSSNTSPYFGTFLVFNRTIHFSNNRTLMKIFRRNSTPEYHCWVQSPHPTYALMKFVIGIEEILCLLPHVSFSSIIWCHPFFKNGSSMFSVKKRGSLFPKNDDVVWYRKVGFYSYICQ